MAKNNAGGKSAAGKADDYEAVLWDFLFDQVTELTNHLLDSQILRLDQIMHVVQAFVYATRIAGNHKAVVRSDTGPLLGQCATDLIHDYCYDRTRALQ
jgi:hypothetical protein